ncbi:hypothetical protein F5B22DRAFT_660014 [Xylaria bambusicola]|uniref:uncharacterized protein n=1 Tax=Xylaria bambusicola TaxID=326684 RepID=UPI002007C817|nr:uncharacterized protein F5B22DRAFT_660014 [Xylaria bambusicola]KAI0506799.1 hypothetical protein F5B22DRAFT_660014 [Xylaria bambusicola]
MSFQDDNIKKQRRVSFAAPDSPIPNNARPDYRPRSTPLKPAIINNGNNTRPPPSAPSSPRTTVPTPRVSRPDPFAGLPIHTVANTPQGLVIDGVLESRGPIGHFKPGFPQTQPLPFTNLPASYNPAQPHQVKMSTVAAGITPDPNAVHFQPPVPDTTNGPYEHIYVPRSDPPSTMVNGGPPCSQPAFYAPGAVPYQPVQPQAFMPPCMPTGPGVAFMNASPVHPGMATAPIPMMAPGCQMPPMQPPQMPGCATTYQPGFMPPMAGGPLPVGPTYVATGIGQPTPPITPTGMPFPAAPMGGIELGKTKSEVDMQNQYNAFNNQMNEPQSMKPADDDKSRMYWCRELDGQWTSRSRYSLDRMGNFRWYVTENGIFYAKMLVE